jgi:hypothetical protein
MTKEKTEQKKDIFILNHIYPEVESTFQFQFKSLNEIKDDCYIVLDTNTLLVPYTVHPKSLQEIKNTYLQLIDFKRLFIPGQVAREFAKQRANKITDVYQQLSRKRNEQGLQKIQSYPLLESINEFEEAQKLLVEIEAKTKEYRDKLGKVLNKVKEWVWNDPVSLVYRDLFREDVIIDIKIDDDQKSEIEKDLERRISHKIPPGYKDSSKPDDGIGDLLIWRTILEIGKRYNKSVIFVSNDVKPDWWYQSEKQALYPRYELVDEFRRVSNQESFHIVTFSHFLDLYGASKEVIEEVIKHEEEQINKSLAQEDYIETVAGRIITLEEAIKTFNLSRIVQRFGTWAVTDYGVECLAYEYFIEKHRLKESDWIDHMKTKNWVNIYDFISALEAARKIYNI